jgi:hypothetical protein
VLRYQAVQPQTPAPLWLGIAVALLALSMVSSTLYYGLPTMMFFFALAAALPARRTLG